MYYVAAEIACIFAAFVRTEKAVKKFFKLYFRSGASTIANLFIFGIMTLFLNHDHDSKSLDNDKVGPTDFVYFRVSSF